MDALQHALWDKAMTGDVKTVEACVRIIERRVKVLGLDRLNGPEKPAAGALLWIPALWEQLKADGKTVEDVVGGSFDLAGP